jgi:hypothetical protein
MVKSENYEEEEEFSEKILYDTLINDTLIFKRREIYITLLNKDGDAEITSIDTLLNSGKTPQKGFEVYHTSLSSGMVIDDMQYKVSSGNGKLVYKTPLNLQNEKKITIYFEKPLAFQEETTIKEEFRWNGMFPTSEEYYFVNIVRPVWVLKFSLKYPQDMEINKFWIDKILQLSGEQEELPNEFVWNKDDGEIISEINPDILCYYKYNWKYKEEERDMGGGKL